MRTYKSNLTLAVALIVSLSAAGIVFAAIFGSGTGEVGLSGGRTIVVNAHNICKKVTNNSSLDILIPTNTATEWQYFRDNAPNKTLNECTWLDLNEGKEITCFGYTQPQGIYGYGRITNSLPYLRLVGYCAVYVGYTTFDTGWVQTASLVGGGNCPAGFGWYNYGQATLDSSGVLAESTYGGGYYANCKVDWSGNVTYPPCDVNDPSRLCYQPPPPPDEGGGGD